VIKGYEQRYGIDFKETFAPVVNFRTVKVLLALAATLDLEIHQMDVKTAFLNGELEEEIYMEIPEGYHDWKTKSNTEFESEPDMVLQLQKSLYGLKQAPRVWNKSLDSFLRSLGFKRSEADHSLYLRHDAIIAVYVDDMSLFAERIETIQQLKQQLKGKYEMTDLGEMKRFLGIEITRDRKARTIRLNQERYIDEVLQRFSMENCKPMKTPLPTRSNLEVYAKDANPDDRLLYQSMLGSIMYAMLWTRPDLAYTISLLGQFSANPGPDHWNCMKHVMRYLKGSKSVELQYSGSLDSLNFHGFTDSEFAGDQVTRKSTSGHIFMMSGGAVSWASKRQSTVAASSTEAEYIATAFAAKEAIWLRQLLREVEQQFIDPKEQSKLPATMLYGDNQGSISLTKNPENHQRTKHIDVQYHFTRARVESHEIAVEYIPTADMTADILTKSLEWIKHERHMRGMGLVDQQSGN